MTKNEERRTKSGRCSAGFGCCRTLNARGWSMPKPLKNPPNQTPPLVAEKVLQLRRE